MDNEIIPENPEYRRYVYKSGTYERIRIDVPCKRIWHMSNIFSNGDVVPCCYDYNSEMKVGNVFEKPFTEIWNGPTYRDLRKKIYYEKDSIPKCRECTMNFKLSKDGWFVEAHDFNIPIHREIFDYMKRFAKLVLPQKVVEAIREMRTNII
jgi:radical SAM protein with 4Fe4S-binding SPASM domain